MHGAIVWRAVETYITSSYDCEAKEPLASFIPEAAVVSIPSFLEIEKQNLHLIRTK